VNDPNDSTVVIRSPIPDAIPDGSPTSPSSRPPARLDSPHGAAARRLERAPRRKRAVRFVAHERRRWIRANPDFPTASRTAGAGAVHRRRRGRATTKTRRAHGGEVISPAFNPRMPRSSARTALTVLDYPVIMPTGSSQHAQPAFADAHVGSPWRRARSPGDRRRLPLLASHGGGRPVPPGVPGTPRCVRFPRTRTRRAGCWAPAHRVRAARRRERRRALEQMIRPGSPRGFDVAIRSSSSRRSSRASIVGSGTSRGRARHAGDADSILDDLAELRSATAPILPVRSACSGIHFPSHSSTRTGRAGMNRRVAACDGRAGRVADRRGVADGAVRRRDSAD